MNAAFTVSGMAEISVVHNDFFVAMSSLSRRGYDNIITRL